jgi:outer membrane lipoprotein-sorting protein
MKKLLILCMGVMFTIACTDKKKDDKKTEEAIQKIDSIQADVEKGIEKLEESTKEVEEELKELDNI